MDRNFVFDFLDLSDVVALRKESVDRNGVGSWPRGMIPVALRKESVDRNKTFIILAEQLNSRSPQGERG